MFTLFDLLIPFGLAVALFHTVSQDAAVPGMMNKHHFPAGGKAQPEASQEGVSQFLR